MELAFITPKETISYENISDIIIPTPNWQKHINNTSGNVDLISKGKIFLKRGSSENPEVIEYYVNNGVMYVEKKVINIVTEDIK